MSPMPTMLFNVLTVLATASTAAAWYVSRPISWLHLPTPPADGYEAVSAKFYIDPNSERATGYYLATSWNFQGHDLQYFGLQPYTPGTRNTTGHIAYSVFGKGTKIGDPERCHDLADGGAGTSCWLDVDLDFGRWYTIESAVVEKTTDGWSRWNGTLVDDNGKRTYIASFWTDKAFGGLSEVAAQWLEWWHYNMDGKTPATRACQPPFRAVMGPPTAGAAVGLPVSFNDGDQEDKCAVAAGESNTAVGVDDDGNIVLSAGFLTY